MSTTVVTPAFRVSYPFVFEARFNELKNKDEYSIVALFKKGENLKVLTDAMELAAKEKWGADKTKWPKNLRNPIKDQGEKAKEVDGKTVLPSGYESGAKFLTLTSKDKPAVLDQAKNEILIKSEFYAGCYARAIVHAYAYDNAGNKGITFYLNALQKVKEGEPLSGRMKPEDQFTAIEVEGNSSAESMFS